MVRKSILLSIAIAVFFMNAVCFCVLSSGTGSRHGSAVASTCSKCLSGRGGPASKSSPDRCGDPTCPHCPGTTPMLTGVHAAAVPVDFAPVNCGLPQQWPLTIAILPTAANTARSDLARAWTDPPTLLNLGCCFTT